VTDKMKVWFKKERVFVYLLIFSPGFWWMIFKLPLIIKEWFNFPYLAGQKLTSVYTEERLVAVGLMRWANMDVQKNITVFSKLVYNRADIFVDEFFSYLSFFSPRLYFQSGDGSIFSPSGVDPVAMVLFPLFILGIINTAKKGLALPFLILLVSGFIAFLAGTKSFSYLWPVLILYIWFSSRGFSGLNKNMQRIFSKLYLVYGSFLIFRMLWLN